MKSKMLLLGFSLVTALLLPVTDGSYFTDVSTRSIQENYDDVHSIWYITAYCYIRYTYSYTCYAAAYYSCGWYGWSSCLYYYGYTCYQHGYADVVCDRCYVYSDPSGNFETDGYRTVLKRYCSAHTCANDCPNTNGCLRGGDTHTVGVTCYRTGYETDGAVSTTFDVSVYSANGPSFVYSGGSSIAVSHDSAGVGSVISTIQPTTSDNGYDYDYARYRQASRPAASYLHQTSDLFYLDTNTGQVKVGKDLTNEFSYFYNMNMCVYDRRGRESCNVLYITLWACFQTPNCTNKEEWSLHDTYGTYTNGHGGSSNLVFSQTFPQPSEHFPYFSSVWHKLTWTFVYNQFPELAINQDTGELYITRNISIWPSWPTKDYRAQVRVANSESCYTTTCDFFVRVHYTNWPIEIRSLPNVPQWYQHEDDDSGYELHDLIVFDYNYDYEDNMTCYIHRISPHEDALFVLEHDGRYKYDSYTLRKYDCQNPDCGYKHPLPSEFTHSAWQRFYCDTDIGCLTYNRTQQYTVTIKCDDAYNTTDEKDFTFNVIKNEVPIYRHLPTLVDLDRNEVSQYDNIFEIMYWDLEEENLIYEYTYQDVATGLDPGYFIGTTWGNFYNQLGNITMTTFLWDKPVNKTYRIHVCGHERRNEICEDLTVDVEEYCSEAPQCSSPSSPFTTDMTLAVGSELFDLSTLTLPPTSSVPFGGLSYSIKSPHNTLFEINSKTGKVTLKESFPEVYPSALYTSVGYVYNTGACGHGTCFISVKVDFVNFPITITNAPTTKTVHEDTKTVLTLFTVLTSDDNEDDPYTCNITSLQSVEPFYLDRSPPKTGYYYVKNRANYALSATPSQYDVEITCYDSYGSSDSYTLVIMIEQNDAPAFDATTFSTAGLSENANIGSYAKGDIVHIVSASDTEGDEIIWNITVDTNMNPLYFKTYSTYAKVYLRRSLNSEYDDGQAFSVSVCIGDAKHPMSSCGDLSVTFTETRTPPSISNMGLWPLTFPEDTAVGTVLFTPTIDNPDAGETATVYMKVYPTKYSGYFRLDKDTNKLLLKKSLNFEEATEFRFEFAVKDNYLMGLENYTGFLYVSNVNEGNTLVIGNNQITFPEDTTVGSALPDLSITCTDIDGDDVSFTIESGPNNDFFSMDSTTGALTLLKEWDLETAIQKTTLLTVQCSDPGGFKSSAEVEITVTDVNEFAPLCTRTYMLSDPLQITRSTSLSALLMTIECSDPDRDDDGMFYSSSVGKGLAYKYFRFLQRSNRKRSTSTAYTDIKLLKPVDLSNDKSFEITFEISDGEGNPLFDDFTISVNYTSEDPDAKQKQGKKCLTCTTNGQVTVAVLAVELVLIALFITHACFAMVCRRNRVLRFSDFDTSRNTKFKPTFSTTSFGRPAGLTGKVNTLNKTAPATAELSVKRSEIRPRSVSSTSSSSSDSDDDEPNRQGRISNKVSVSVSLSPGLPAPIYGSGSASVRPGQPGLPFGRPALGVHKGTGLPPPIYSTMSPGRPTS